MQYIEPISPQEKTTPKPISNSTKKREKRPFEAKRKPLDTKNPAYIVWNWVTGRYGVPETPTPITWYNWPLHINHVNTIHSIGMPILGYFLARQTPLRWETAVFAAIFLFITGTGVTAGYHRLWAHRSYQARTPLRIFLALAGASSLEGSARYWATEHRAHHRYIDTDKDPYSAAEGFLWSHIGWVVMNRDQGRITRVGHVDNSDLREDWVVVFQHKYFWQIGLLVAYVLPTIVAMLWGDAWGGFLYAGLWRIQVANHSIFCVNSVAHWLGDQPFDDKHTARSNFITALLTFGEGWHNYHHEFPTDYRNGLEWYEFDPTKWLIQFFAFCGLAYNLKTVKKDEIEKSRVMQMRKKVEALDKTINWGPSLSELPVMTWDEFQSQVKNEGRALIAIEGVIHDMESFIDEHPGGRAMIKSGIGRDATARFNGGTYEHSNAAHNMLTGYRVALLQGGGEVEAWKEENAEMIRERIAAGHHTHTQPSMLPHLQKA